ncbi:flagellar motor protein MotB [Methylobacterium variabile]|jgi:outer membrane protein OmpA-like peptidoglycan-associated protein|uniref:Flagellar motor protein MotB n=1 Tax=Methylobacterium variabile TaxID=298794 RepID=A0A0J6T4R9_9HYPH|nr:OmpA family protein [Methylobacterium variabile]KMO40802.1 flagellar motor protein MotB [Methylobacterium variabile]
MRILTLIAALKLAAISGAALAGPAYTADEIVKHFATADQPDLGRSRGLCIGTHSECNAGVATRKPAGGFDLVVNFEYNSDLLTPAAKANLDEFAKALQDARLKSASFVVEGHTDGRGGDDFNLGLSSRRANTVVKYLAGRGVQAGQLSAKGYGKARPLASDPLDPANRRVEARLATP